MRRGRTAIAPETASPGADVELDAALGALLERLREYDIAQVCTIKGFADKPGNVDPDTLFDLAGYTLATAMSRSSSR